MTDYDIALISGSLAIAGTLLGVVFTYRLSIKSAERQFEHLRAISKLDAWNTAAREFRHSLGGELAALEANSESLGDVMDFLKSAYASHAAAVAVFEEYLPINSRQAFRTAWLQHCYNGEDPNDTNNPKWSGLDHDSLLFLHYSNEFNLANRSSARVQAIENVRALLAFAKDA